MTTSAGSFRVHLINVSTTGALVHLGDPPPRGTRIDIDLGAGTAEGRVIWTKGARFGVAFDRRINDRVIDRLVGCCRRASWHYGNVAGDGPALHNRRNAACPNTPRPGAASGP